MKPYTFSQFIRMKPGSVLGGLSWINPTHGWELSGEWSTRGIPEGTTQVRLHVVLEHLERWRTVFASQAQVVGLSKVYRLPKPPGIQDYRKVFFTFGFPVGLYLGHLLRLPTTFYVNILTPEGVDCWI